LNRQEILPPTESRKPRFFYGYIIVLVGFLIITIQWGALQSFGVFLKPMSAEFGWTRAMTSGSFSLVMVVSGLLFIVTGRLNDRYGPRIISIVAGLFLSLGFSLLSQISALWQLYLLYGVFFAMGMSGGLVPLASTVARWFVKSRGMMTAITLSGVGAGALIGPPVASHLVSNYGWRNAYLIMGIVALVLIMVAAQFLRRDPSQKGLFPYGESEAGTGSLNLDVEGTSLSQATRTGQFWMLGFIYLCFGFGSAATLVHIVPYATDLGISPLAAASILAIIGGVGIVGRLGIGRVSDRIGNKSSLIACFILLAVAFLWLLFAKELWMLRLFAVIFGIGWGGIAIIVSPIVAELFGLRAHGVILGTVTVGLAVGGAGGTLIAGYVFDTASSYYPVFLAYTVLSIIGLILALFLRVPRKGRLMGER